MAPMKGPSSFRPSIMMLASFAVAVALAACGSGRHVLPDGRTADELADRDLAMVSATPARAEGSAFSEQLTFRLELEGGGRGYVRLLVSNLAGANGRADLRVSFDLPDRPSLGASVRKPRGQWSTAAGQLEAVLGDSTISARVGEAELKFRHAKLEVDLELESALPALRPEGGRADFGQGRYYVTTLIAPRAKVTGTLRIPREGQDPEEIELEGLGFVEHRAGNVAPYLMAKRWINVNGIGAEGSLLVSAFERAESLGGKVQGWLVYATDERVEVYEPDLDVRADGFQADAESGYQIPLKVQLASGDALTGIVKADALEGRLDDLRSLSKLERAIVERLMRPWTFLYRARYLLKLRTADSPEPRTLAGDATYSFQQLK